MKINFTNNQYKKLLGLVYIGNWIINAHEIPGKGTSEQKKYDDILGYVGSFAKDFGKKELVDIEGDKAYPSRSLEEEMLEYVDEYEEEYFWDELADRMATKEMFEIYGEDKLNQMSREDYFILHDRLVDKWSDEFIENGLENLGRK